MAISSFGIFLMMKKENAYEKLVDIKDIPDLGGAPESLESTTLTDSIQTYVQGIQSAEALEFTANYTPEDYKKLKDSAGIKQDYSVWFGGTAGADGTVTPTGANGKFNFSGTHSPRVTGVGVNEVVGMASSIAPSTPIVMDET